MKKIYILLIGIGLFFSSCEKFLEEDNRSNALAEDFYTTEEGYNSLIFANYSQLREIYGDFPWLFCAGTDLYAEGRDAEPPGLSRYFDLGPSSEGVDHLYRTCYKAIQMANMALYYSDKTEEMDNINQLVGEIKYLRANAYFLLVQTYGGVGIVTQYITSPVLEFDRNSAEEVYNLILEDLEGTNGALNLVADGGFNGRVNLKAVQHLLAKVYLTRGYESFGGGNDFATAASYADAAIGGQGLNLTFEELWTPGNEMNEEVLFSVQFSAASQATDPENLGHRQANFFGPYMGGSEVSEYAPYRTYNLCPTDFAISLFEQGDERWNATFMTECYARYYDYYRGVKEDSYIEHYYAPAWATSADIAAYRDEHPSASIYAYGSYSAGVHTNNFETIPVKKFDDPSSPFGAVADDGRVSTRDIILSRLGDTYLLAAEAYLQAGQAATGLARLNTVRARAGAAAATSGEFDIDYILDERGRELLGEYHRWFDLKRTGKLVERASAHHYLIDAANFNGNNGELKILRPIPQEAIDLNQNKNFPQNPAYN